MELDSGNVAWMLTAAALVLFMTPGLGFFYGGLTRNKNVLATIMQSFITTGVVANSTSGTSGFVSGINHGAPATTSSSVRKRPPALT